MWKVLKQGGKRLTSHYVTRSLFWWRGRRKGRRNERGVTRYCFVFVFVFCLLFYCKATNVHLGKKKKAGSGGRKRGAEKELGKNKQAERG